MITMVDSAAALNAALKVAQAGDTIQLAAGSYAGVTALNLHFASDVTVTAAPGAQAVLTDLTVNASSGLNFSNLEFYADPAGVQTPFQVTHGSTDIHFDRLNVHGSLDGNPQNDVQGFLIRDSSNVSVTNSEFQQLWYAVDHHDMQGLTISGNNFHDIRMDGVRGGGSSFVTVTNNSFSSFHPVLGDHADAIQFWNLNASAHDITVADNLVQRGAGDPIQGVFMRDGSGTMPFQNVHIAGNWVIGGDFNGITVMGGANVTISNDYVQGFTDKVSWIRVETTTGGQVIGDSANTYITTTTDVNVTMTSDAKVPQTADGGASALSLWQQAHPAGVSLSGTSIADTLTGGAGADTLAGGAGADLLTGGGGNDVFVVAGHSTIVEAANGGFDTVLSSVSFALPANVENLTLTGTGSTNATGNAANNILIGNDQANVLTGAGGDDTLVGMGGADILKGGRGDDLLIGGPGADHFVFLKGDGHDVITDFGLNGDHDVLDITGFTALGYAATLTDTTSGVMVSFTTGDSILLLGVHAASLNATALGYVF